MTPSTTASAAIPRYDIYAFIHKGLRAFMAHTLVRVGRLDVHDATELAEVSEELSALLRVLRNHVRHENEFVHAAMEARAPGSTRFIADDHLQHLAELDRLGHMLQRLPGDAALAQGLYRALAQFTAENFEHMQHEETDHNAVLWAHFRDDELLALEHRIVASLTPEESAWSMRWMLPHLTPAERAALLGGMRQSAPADVFDGLLGGLRPLLGGRDWRKLSTALGLA